MLVLFQAVKNEPEDLTRRDSEHNSADAAVHG